MSTYIVESEFEHEGYTCVVVFQASGHRCGYVGIPTEHPLYGKDYGDYLDIKKEDIQDREVSGIFPLIAAALDDDERIRIEAYFKCHGGITYADGGENSKYPIESNLWFFGFDCAHYNDGKDLQLAYERFPERREHIQRLMEDDAKYGLSFSCKVREEAYVADECKKLAEQLKEFEKEGK